MFTFGWELQDRESLDAILGPEKEVLGTGALLRLQCSAQLHGEQVPLCLQVATPGERSPGWPVQTDGFEKKAPQNLPRN